MRSGIAVSGSFSCVCVLYVTGANQTVLMLGGGMNHLTSCIVGEAISLAKLDSFMVHTRRVLQKRCNALERGMIDQLSTRSLLELDDDLPRHQI